MPAIRKVNAGLSLCGDGGYHLNLTALYGVNVAESQSSVGRFPAGFRFSWLGDSRRLSLALMRGLDLFGNETTEAK